MPLMKFWLSFRERKKNIKFSPIHEIFLFASELFSEKLNSSSCWFSVQHCIVFETMKEKAGEKWISWVHFFAVVQARGPASEKFAERLAAECADYWQSGRYWNVVFKVTVRPDWICMRVVSLDRP
jgi:hypothetical protein